MKKLVLILLWASSFVPDLHAQDTLPSFSVSNVGKNRIIVGWTNTYETVKQISIQRSFDSLKGYSSIMTVLDPTAPQNGYVDAKATHDHMFYRLYILLDKGVYLFTKPRKPVMDTMRRTRYDDAVTAAAAEDSVSVPDLGIGISKPRPEVFVPSLHVYTNKDGYVRINLPEDEKKKYRIKFYEEDGSFLFELKDIPQRSFKLDKTSFYHSGWFRFELFEGDELKEKHKFFLARDF